MSAAPKAFPLRGRWTRSEAERPDEVSAEAVTEGLPKNATFYPPVSFADSPPCHKGGLFCHCEATPVAVAISCTDNRHCETCVSQSWQSYVNPDIDCRVASLLAMTRGKGITSLLAMTYRGGVFAANTEKMNKFPRNLDKKVLHFWKIMVY